MSVFALLFLNFFCYINKVSLCQQIILVSTRFLYIKCFVSRNFFFIKKLQKNAQKIAKN